MLGNDAQGGQTVNITLPYASFDLQLTQFYPGINQTTQYFPLRRAANDTQHTLGRTFLQESYITVDYERLNFSVSSAVFHNNVPQQIIPILSINSTNSTGPGNNITKMPSPPTHKLGAGATAGIIIAAIAVCTLITGAFTFWFLRRRKLRNATNDDASSDRVEVDGTSTPSAVELYDANGKKFSPELQGSDPNLALDEKTGRLQLEMRGSQGGVEMPASQGAVEMAGSHGGAEMDGNHGAAEMAAPEMYELPADYGDRGLSVERHETRSTRSGSTPRSGRRTRPFSFLRGQG